MLNGSPPLPPSPIVKYRSPASALPGAASGLNAGMPGVVVGERLPQPEQLARRPAVVGAGARRLRGPLEQHGVVRWLVAAGRQEIRRGRHVARIEIGVELAVAWRALTPELWVEGEALEPALATGGLHRVCPVRGVDIEVERNGFAVVAHAVERPAHVADEQPARARLVNKVHHPRRDAVDVGQRRKLREVDADGAFGGDRPWEWVVGLSRSKSCCGLGRCGRRRRLRERRVACRRRQGDDPR